MKPAAKNILSLSVICAIVAVLMAITAFITGPIIDKNNALKADKALLEVMPNGGGFVEVDLTDKELPETVTKAHKAQTGGYVVELSVQGFKGEMKILCGVDTDGKVTGSTCYVHGESWPDKVEEYSGRFTGLDLEGVEKVDTYSGMTGSSRPYREAIIDAVKVASVLAGGSADFRDDEAILQDNLNAALPEAKGDFSRLFIIENLVGIKAVYTAGENGAVYLLGKPNADDVFVAVKADGSISEASEEDKATVLAAKALLDASKSNMISNPVLSSANPAELVKTEKTDSGNYIFTVHAKGITYGSPWYTPTPIVIKVSMTAEGKILDCRTLSQGESAGYGDKCAESSFTDQFSGKNNTNYTGIDAIAGCTITNNAYFDGIAKAYAALSVLESEEYRSNGDILREVSAILPAGEGQFKKEFIAEVIIGVTAVYTAENGAGSVYVLGDKMIGVMADGNYVNYATNEEKAMIDAAKKALTASKKTEVTVPTLPEDKKVSLEKVEKTASGNYIFTVHTYGITYDSPWYTPTPIVITVSMTKDGKILDCVTVSQGESKNYGDACAEDSYTSEYVGKTETDYKTVDSIAGCTVTHDAYLAGIAKAYAALDLLNGAAS